LGAIQWDIELYNGRTSRLSVACVVEDPDSHRVEVRDLTGWTGAMQIRPTADDATVYAEAVVTIDIPTGVVTAVVTDEETADATWRAGVYDLVITDGINPDTLAVGVARLRRSVTR
jgi:hypothetical protein